MQSVPYLDLTFQHRDIKGQLVEAFEEFLDEGRYVLGSGVNRFEAALATYHNKKHCIGVSNGLDAMTIGLKSMGVGPGDEVIVPSNTYIATWLAITAVGATIVPVEPDPLSYNIVARDIERAITDKTKVILPVHLYGQSCDMEEIMKLARNRGLQVLEDNAQSIGAAHKDRLTGTWGDIGAFSFYPGKNLGALGDAGAILTDDDELAQVCRSLRNYGSHKKYYNDRIGMNARLDEVQARILSIKLPYLEKWNEERRRMADLYVSLLKDYPGITLPLCKDRLSHVWHIFPILVDKRDALQQYLKARKIVTLIHYPLPPHLQQAYKQLSWKEGDFPIAENMASSTLSLPIYPGLSEDQVSYVCEQVGAFFTT